MRKGLSPSTSSIIETSSKARATSRLLSTRGGVACMGAGLVFGGAGAVSFGARSAGVRRVASFAFLGGFIDKRLLSRNQLLEVNILGVELGCARKTKRILRVVGLIEHAGRPDGEAHGVEIEA